MRGNDVFQSKDRRDDLTIRIFLVGRQSRSERVVEKMESWKKVLSPSTWDYDVVIGGAMCQ